LGDAGLALKGLFVKAVLGGGGYGAGVPERGA